MMSAPEAEEPLSSTPSPVQLDALTVMDDTGFLAKISHQVKLPDYVRDGLAELY